MRLTQLRRHPRTQDAETTTGTRSSPWRIGVPVVCLLAGLLLATTHGVSGGGEIRRSDAPRLVDLVHDAQTSVDRLSVQRDALAAQVDSTHGASAGTALSAMLEMVREGAIDLRQDDAFAPIQVRRRSARPQGLPFAAKDAS